jgi:hypothetical protein
MITIEGLTQRQKQLMDIMWGCQTLDQVTSFIRALPTRKDQLDAASLVKIATWDSIEQEVGFTEEVTDAANDCISRARS